jgi:protein SCO1/2
VNRVRRLTVLLVAVLAVSACSDAAGSGGGWSGTAISNPYPLPDQRFTDTAGEDVVPTDDFAGEVTLVFFGYTRCPDICNVVLANLASALRESRPAVREATRVVFISVDPTNDTPSVLREYLDRFDPAFRGLVADDATVESAAKDLHIGYERPDGTEAGHADHGTYTTGFVDGDAVVVWSQDTSVAELRADLRRLARLA